ncbi:hypothetical protein AMTR_s00064p00203620 [Amborella trichopoda]|uniref:Uncharacterized protein n=1 Tax=Amborella trichopoda TaxID=13333 RepID=U5DC80_AMBTC|nr:hypothetical protein AMTR_s00064p00203620 [Amborella trichopoda]
MELKRDMEGPSFLKALYKTPKCGGPVNNRGGNVHGMSERVPNPNFLWSKTPHGMGSSNFELCMEKPHHISKKLKCMWINDGLDLDITTKPKNPRAVRVPNHVCASKICPLFLSTVHKWFEVREIYYWELEREDNHIMKDLLDHKCHQNISNDLSSPTTI